MYCQKCGCEIADDALFCPKCGATVVGADAPAQPADPVQPADPAQPADPKKSNKGLIGIIVAVAVIAVVAIIAVVVILGGKSKNNITPANDAPITQDAEAATQNSEEPAAQTLTAANWYDYVFVDGGGSVKLPCTLREFFDAIVAVDREKWEAEINSMTPQDVGESSHLSLYSDIYGEDTVRYEIRIEANGATSVWDYRVKKLEIEACERNSTAKYEKVNLQPGLYIGMTEEEVITLLGEPSDKRDEFWTYYHPTFTDNLTIEFNEETGRVTGINVWMFGQ